MVETVTELLRFDQTKVDHTFLRQTLLTPRSQEAFRKSGILPEDIVYPQPVDDDPAVRQIKLTKALTYRTQQL
jgi:hypothetical protein